VLEVVKEASKNVGNKAEGMTPLFFVFLLYLFFLFLRPMELFAPWLEPFRPMVIIWVISFLGSLTLVLRDRNPAATAKHYWVLIGLFFAVFWSLIWQGMASAAFDAAGDFSAAFLLFFLISFNVLNLKRIRQACFVILVCLFTQALMGINAYYTGYMSEQLVLQQRKDEDSVEAPEERPPVPARDDSGAFMWRVRGVGFLSDPNDFAQTLIMALPMLWWFVRKGAWFRNLMFVAMPASVMVYCITLTNSRGAIMGMGSMLFLGMRSKLGNVKSLILLGLAAAGILVVGMTGGRAMSSKERSAEERIEAWMEGFQMLRSSPLFGIGYGKFGEHWYITAHNSFVLGFAEMGVFGYFFWIALLVLGFMTVGRVANHAPVGSEERLAGNILRSSLVGYVTCAWFLSRTYQPVLYCLLALCTAVWVCACRSPACANIAPLQAPLKIFKITCIAVVLSMSAVYMFILQYRFSG